MENYNITLSTDKQIHRFQVAEYPHEKSGSCKYHVFQNDQFVASFEPDRQHFLHICQNPAKLDEELLHLLADQIEARHPQENQLGGFEPIEFDSDDEFEAPPQSGL